MPMTYQEIINAADELYPNGYTADSKITQIYVQEQKLLRTIYRRKTATAYDIVADQFLYPLDYHYSKIIQVVWDGQTIDAEVINAEDTTPPFLYTYEGGIGRYPTPELTVTGGLIIIHYVEPVKPTLTTLDQYPSFDNDFPMVQVYNLCKWMAERTREYDVANGFIMQLNDELKEFKRANPEPDVPDIRVE
jgi:hypothetical protein